MSPAPRRTATQALGVLLDAPAVPVHADEDPERLIRVASACAQGGVRAFEATDRLRGSFDAFVRLRAHVDRTAPELMLGVGSVREAADAERYLDAGAEFVVTPFVAPEIAAACQQRDALYLPGAFTPTEVRAARATGARIVKLFPAGPSGPDYLRHLRGPDPETRFMPTGGLRADPDALSAWASAGASCVGLGSSLIGAGADDPEAADALRARCAAALGAVLAARPRALGNRP